MNALPAPCVVLFVSNVARITAFYEQVAAVPLGGFVKPASAEWEARGFRACDGHDPEGNVIQVRESANHR